MEISAGLYCKFQYKKQDNVWRCMMNDLVLKFGAEVQDQQKHAGNLHKLVVNPQGTHVTHILIQQGLLFKHHFVLPLETVVSTTTDEIRLNLDHDEIDNYPTFVERKVEVGIPQRDAAMLQRASGPIIEPHHVDHITNPSSGLYIEKHVIREGVNVEDLLWSSDTTLHSLQGYAGNLVQVVVDAADGRIQHLIMRQGKLLEKFLTVPAELIERSSEAEIQLGIREETVADLAPYDPHHVLDFVELASMEEPPLVGEKPKKNNLLAELTTLLVNDPRTETAVIEIICEGSKVNLEGSVKNQQTKEAAAEVVSRHPDVLTVNNNLKVEATY